MKGTAATLVGALAGCAAEPPPPWVASPFSRSKLLSGLEKLRLAFEAKQHHVTPSLLPGVSASVIRERCAWFPVPVPEEIVALYSWHEGQGKETAFEDFPFWFRDCSFSSLDIAQDSYRMIMGSYGTEPRVHELLRTAFPFATFDAGFLVLPTQTGGYKGVARPVISVFQGMHVWFHSMNAMIDTCVKWVSDPGWSTPDGLESNARETAIWEKHNPGRLARMMADPW